MTIRLLFWLPIFPLVVLGCATSQNQATIEQYNQFAVRSAKLQLWNEAIFRWQHILEIEPQNAKTYNNLGVAYEALGKIDEAIEAYKRATELDPDNKFYRFNYRKCRLHVQRSRMKPSDADGVDATDSSES
ncbi:MAG: tetratricopeptide repeat protein [Candidatus Poribacteria bacterium]|nr:tetratricopeptide repeat protein [Candidatus Poribacteria bacterium]